MPNVKQFVKGGEAQEYHNVEVTFVATSKQAVLILSFGNEKDDVADFEVERVDLRPYDTGSTQDLHALLVDKGFQRKSKEELQQFRQEFDRQAAKDQERNRIRQEGYLEFYQNERLQQRLEAEQQQHKMDDEHDDYYNDSDDDYEDEEEEDDDFFSDDYGFGEVRDEL
uniref:Uncharacterized protein n=1 Tax=Attheya septentrionalis TaxID=420275 RepID=A0A7S2UGE1_9STRA|mmetsp:Transcript_22577/g.40744  ORF Transcript_22577/g.40744 Transcript_22577/m.40744 type:complete len:168 (+) Transcript_22577:198-701(+)|eukprot:CAMPEP_0198279858 /NCGR_PEP_ID=MMETSP1449-20131203/71_1 /TAXON_ID=420275 /ORGANISM="Attheya septentrionalis, Strain CCMP2084" /LENGTH=167 /DNA_ID=CAMNT_0043975087 /DNA_START=192 /DNA_END=695 /DNA_ORIENTATION=-